MSSSSWNWSFSIFATYLVRRIVININAQSSAKKMEMCSLLKKLWVSHRATAIPEFHTKCSKRLLKVACPLNHNEMHVLWCFSRRKWWCSTYETNCRAQFSPQKMGCRGNFSGHQVDIKWHFDQSILYAMCLTLAFLDSIVFTCRKDTGHAQVYLQKCIFDQTRFKTATTCTFGLLNVSYAGWQEQSSSMRYLHTNLRIF